jgi:hypothetical protein
VLRRVLAAVAGGVLLAGGCSGGGGTPPATSTTAAVATTAPPPGDRQLQSIVVQAGDLPAGWTAKPAHPPTDRAAADAAYAQCMGIADTDGDQVAMAYSPDFTNGSLVIASTAASYRTRTAVPVDAAALLNPKASACLLQVGKGRLAASLPKGATIKTDTLKITPGPGSGPANVVATAASSVSYVAAGHQLSLNDTIVWLAAPRIEARIDFYSVGTPINPAVEAAVVAQVAHRVTFGS